MGEMIAKRQIGRLWVVGSNATTGPVIEASYRRLLELLDAHLERSRSSWARDRARATSRSMVSSPSWRVRSHAGRARARDRAAGGRVGDVVEDLSGLEPTDAGWWSRDEIPPTFAALLAEAGRVYAPFLLANAAALRPAPSASSARSTAGRGSSSRSRIRRSVSPGCAKRTLRSRPPTGARPTPRSPARARGALRRLGDRRCAESRSSCSRSSSPQRSRSRSACAFPRCRTGCSSSRSRGSPKAPTPASTTARCACVLRHVVAAAAPDARQGVRRRVRGREVLGRRHRARLVEPPRALRGSTASASAPCCSRTSTPTTSASSASSTCRPGSRAGRRRCACYGPPGVERVVAGFQEAYALDTRLSRRAPRRRLPAARRTAHEGDADRRHPVRRRRRAGRGRPAGSPPSRWTTRRSSPAYGYRFDYRGRSVVVSGDTAKSRA